MRAPTVHASAPGKLILMGEHAAVYGRPALVAAIGLRARARLAPRRASGVELDLGDLGHRRRLSWDELARYSGEARAAWRLYARHPSRKGFERVRGEDPDHLVKVALGEAVEDLDGGQPPGLEVRVESEIPIGAGFGSSAALAVSLVAGLLAAAGRPREDARIERLAFEAERRQHGMPSGVDHRTVLQGGIVWARRRGRGGVEAEAVAADARRLRALRVFDTGRPAEETGEVVAAVRSARDRRPEEFEERLGRMEELTRRFRGWLTGSPGRGRGAAEPIRRYEACLEELGVVPDPVRRLIRGIEAAGGAAKISGAGALSGAAAGGLLVHALAADGPAPELPLELPRELSVELGAEGLRLEVGG